MDRGIFLIKYNSLQQSTNKPKEHKEAINLCPLEFESYLRGFCILTYYDYLLCYINRAVPPCNEYNKYEGGGFLPKNNLASKEYPNQNTTATNILEANTN